MNATSVRSLTATQLQLAATAVAAAFLLVGGAVYAVLWIYGLLVDRRSDANFVPLNNADDWVHFVLAVAMIGLGLVLSRGVGRTANPLA